MQNGEMGNQFCLCVIEQEFGCLVICKELLIINDVYFRVFGEAVASKINRNENK